MALQDLAGQYMLEQSRQPTQLSQYFAGKDKREADMLNQQVTLSNLATAEQQRSAVGQEMEQSQYGFDLEKQKMQKYGQLARMIQNEPDPEKRYEMAKNWYSIAAEHNDTVGMQMAVPMLKTYAPDQEYGYQEQAADLGLEESRAGIGLQKAQTAGQYADISQGNIMAQAAMLRAQGKGAIKVKPLQAQEKDDLITSMSGQEWFKDLGGTFDKRSREIKPGSAKAQAAGDIALGVEYLMQKAAENGVTLLKEDAYGRVLSGLQAEGEGAPITKKDWGRSDDWNRAGFQAMLNNEVIKLSRVGSTTNEPVEGLFVNEQGQIVDADGNPADLGNQ